MTGGKGAPDRVIGRRALVTGGSGGIGTSIVEALAEEGADVAVQWYRNRNEADRMVEMVDKNGRQGIAVQANLLDVKSVHAMRDVLHDQFGKVDTLINCAGINRDSLFSRMTDEQWDEVIEVNLSGVFHCCRAFVEEISASGHGRIINISSLVGQMGNIGQVNYAASKSGMIGFAKALARELAGQKTTVNVIAPGFIDTPMVQKIPENVKQKILSQIPMGRFGTPREVAMSVVYLVSPEADYITGTVLNMNGGMYL
ncbi:MAG: 3-oxoacyl-ACP reductase FabG [Thermoplasmata archaeon]